MTKGRTEFTSLSSWLVTGPLIAAVALLAFWLLKTKVTQSLHRADCLELLALYDRWIEAGRPVGDNLSLFMEGRRKDFVVAKDMLQINGDDYFTQFALTKPKSKKPGVLTITTNRVLIWKSSAGSSEIVTAE